MLLITTSPHLKVLTRPVNGGYPPVSAFGGVNVAWVTETVASRLASQIAVKLLDVFHSPDPAMPMRDDEPRKIAAKLGIHVNWGRDIYNGKAEEIANTPGVYVCPTAFDGYVEGNDCIMQVYPVDGEYRFAFIQLNNLTVVTYALNG